MNFLKASRENFLLIGIEITSERQAPDGEYLIHFEVCDSKWVAAWGMDGFSAMTYEEVSALFPDEIIPIAESPEELN